MRELFALLLIMAVTVVSAQKVMVPITGFKSTDVITNHELLPQFLTEFYDGARYYKIDYGVELKALQKVLLIDEDPAFLGGVSTDGRVIFLNSDLVDYPNLMRVIFFRQMGKLYGLSEDDAGKGHGIMGTHWDINLQHEIYAERLRRRHEQKKRYFEAMAEKRGLEKRL